MTREVMAQAGPPTKKLKKALHMHEVASDTFGLSFFFTLFPCSTARQKFFVHFVEIGICAPSRSTK